ncbi:hypothetical protein CEN40_24345 [Fischerella thermalis CCMEE 5205]|uniref:hypothetical protein n=1 Tax=Fischerella thermalis TaxID=372787 RepID=UPI000C800639|nr:hypothetical protein CEN40_24345 [Fischerella thermalis CCMEE 5205]
MTNLLRNSSIPYLIGNILKTTVWGFKFINSQVKLYKEAWFTPTFHELVLEIANLPPGKMPTRKMLAGLLAGWGNNHFAANLDYLEEVAKQAVKTPGPILECGSGLTTILLGLLAGRRGVEIWSLEHIPQWYTRINTVLERYEISGVNLCLSPLHDFGGFCWYNPPFPCLPNNFCLVICDGPPSNQTPGGRYGLLPIFGQHLCDNALILLDDADREGEAEVLRRWTIESKVSVLLHKLVSGSFAFVTYPNKVNQFEVNP